MKTVHPIEILTEGRPRGDAAIYPYLRLVARMVDYGVFFFILYWFAPEIIRWLWIIPAHFAAWVPIETLLMSLVGTTLGKWLVHTEVRKGHAKRLPFSCALRRSMGVWVRGMGLGITIVNLLCMSNAYYQLKVKRITGWDRDEGTLVIHHRLGKVRLGCAIVLAIASMGFYLFYA